MCRLCFWKGVELEKEVRRSPCVPPRLTTPPGPGPARVPLDRQNLALSPSWWLHAVERPSSLWSGFCSHQKLAFDSTNLALFLANNTPSATRAHTYRALRIHPATLATLLNRAGQRCWLHGSFCHANPAISPIPLHAEKERLGLEHPRP